ncbi:MAG: Ribosomal-protein-alanine acetyltransferase, partial [Proteiniphilum acetatigenes]
MKKVALFLADGFEEIEALATVDILRRAQIPVTTVSVTGKKEVAGAHSIPVIADSLFNETDFSQVDYLVLPGGMPGAQHLNEHEGLKKLITQFDKRGEPIAAICAAPMVLGELGLLRE